MDVTTIRNAITFDRAKELFELFKNKYFFIDFLNKELLRNNVGFIIIDGIIKYQFDEYLEVSNTLGDVSFYVDKDFFGFEFFNIFRVALTQVKYESIE